MMPLETLLPESQRAHWRLSRGFSNWEYWVLRYSQSTQFPWLHLAKVLQDKRQVQSIQGQAGVGYAVVSVRQNVQTDCQCYFFPALCLCGTRGVLQTLHPFRLVSVLIYNTIQILCIKMSAFWSRSIANNTKCPIHCFSAPNFVILLSTGVSK